MITIKVYSQMFADNYYNAYILLYQIPDPQDWTNITIVAENLCSKTVVLPVSISKCLQWSLAIQTRAPMH